MFTYSDSLYIKDNICVYYNIFVHAHLSSLPQLCMCVFVCDALYIKANICVHIQIHYI